MPAKTKIVASGTFQGAIVGPGDAILAEAVAADPTPTLIDQGDDARTLRSSPRATSIAHGINAYRHNRFSLVPIWCYRRSKDRMPYGWCGARDIQQDHETSAPARRCSC